MKILEWLLAKTKVGSAFETVRGAVEGKKTYIVGVATIVPALANIILAVSQDGLPALMNATHTSDWTQLMAGLAMITGRAAIAKAS